MRALKTAGHEVFILTGALPHTVGGDPQWRLHQLQELGVTQEDFTQMVIAMDTSFDGVGLKKGEFCATQNVQLMVEDTPLFLEGIAKKSPHTVRVLVTNNLEVAHGR